MTRPWRVFVRDIGPSFSFSTEERARARAVALTDGSLPDTYAEVLVYSVTPARPETWRRTIYRPNQEPVTQELRAGSWGRVAGL